MTPLGYVMLPIGLAGLILSKRWLYRLFVFFALFSATSVANFGEGENGSALQVWMFFGSLWLARMILDHLPTFSFAIDRRILRPCLWLMAFLLVASLSLIMPAYINGSLTISSPVVLDDSETPLFLTRHNVTQLLYLVLGCAVAISVAQSNLRDECRAETERVVLLSGAFVALWGLLQFSCTLTGLPYPDYVFNNSGSAAGQGFQELLVGVGRISSVAVEPSVLAQGLIALLPLTLPAWLRRGSILSVGVDRFCGVLFIVVLILCTSSVAYAGLLVSPALVFPLLVRTGEMSMRRALRFAAVIAVTLVTLAILAAYTIPVVREILIGSLFDKYSAGSGVDRAWSIGLAFGYFQEYPLLGIGWGSATSHDLVVKLLSNVGVLGAFAFLGAMYLVIRANWRTLEPLLSPASLSRATWFLSFTSFLFTNIINGFPLAFGNFWLVLGVAISTGWKPEPDKVQP